MVTFLFSWSLPSHLDPFQKRFESPTDTTSALGISTPVSWCCFAASRPSGLWVPKPTSGQCPKPRTSQKVLTHGIRCLCHRALPPMRGSSPQALLQLPGAGEQKSHSFQLPWQQLSRRAGNQDPTSFSLQQLCFFSLFAAGWGAQRSLRCRRTGQPGGDIKTPF